MLDIEIDPSYTMRKKVNDKNLCLSQEQIEILKSFNIQYQNMSLRNLILELDDLYNQTGDACIDNLLDVLSEQDYYQNYKK